MSDAGYTLVETLTALAIVSLAIGGLSAAAQVLARHQAMVGQVVLDTEAPRAAQAALEQLLGDSGPFGAHEAARFVGATRQFAFDCGGAEPCEVALLQGAGGEALRISSPAGERSLPLRRRGLRFRYEGARGASEVWPPQASGRQALRALSIVPDDDRSGPALIQARIWAEQPVACQFDVILQDCR